MWRTIKRFCYMFATAIWVSPTRVNRTNENSILPTCVFTQALVWTVSVFHKGNYQNKRDRHEFAGKGYNNANCLTWFGWNETEMATRPVSYTANQTNKSKSFVWPHLEEVSQGITTPTLLSLSLCLNMLHHPRTNRQHVSEKKVKAIGKTISQTLVLLLATITTHLLALTEPTSPFLFASNWSFQWCSGRILNNTHPIPDKPWHQSEDKHQTPAGARCLPKLVPSIICPSIQVKCGQSFYVGVAVCFVHDQIHLKPSGISIKNSKILL